MTSSVGARLVDFCGSFGDPLAASVQFKASPGEHVTFEYLGDARSNWSDGPSDQHPLSFWCGGGGESGATAGVLAKCFQVVGANPAATLDKAEERGRPGSVMGTTGYALFLTVQHPGVVEIDFNLDCERTIYGLSYTSSPTFQVLTILPP